MLIAVILAGLPLRKGMQRWVIFCQGLAFQRLYSFIPAFRFLHDPTNDSHVQEF